ncbi:MAG TPA: bifunctional phosphoribosylaminoimidazolecarboxamide formyltransferase/IMP cyclohydrolase [Pirellulaceae bacterium]|nr:bifunctional phosphoribosylaminoimidazolecarboxamide formyltransferase/IMP cyclohydrolase [Pirellulaceae bacterium]
MDRVPIKRALISVSDKSGLAELARELAAAGVELYSTGGTRKFLLDNGFASRDVAEYTAFPEMMHGRVKTLHPKVFGGILCRRDHEEDIASCQQHGIELFDLVVVNLYPFEQTIARSGVTPAEAIENIDIGGPSLVRAAAKNHAFTTIATEPGQYDTIIAELRAGGTTLELRQKLAAAAFAHTAIYDAAIATWFSGYIEPDAPFPAVMFVALNRKSLLRYGENPHQKGAVYVAPGCSGASVLSAPQLHGKELSYNNLLDLDSALAIVRVFREPAASVIKHNNPCGAAAAATLADAAKKALDGDPQSAFGGVLAFNRAVDSRTAEVLATPGLFIEAIAAPSFEPAALEILTTKPKWKANVRLLAVGPLDSPPAPVACRPMEGGMLVQEADLQADPDSEWKIVTQKQPDDSLLADLHFGWWVVRHVKSNAIVLAKETSLIGCGAGQMSRVDSVDIAIQKAGDRAKGSILASDAFFPFADSIHKAAAAGVAAIIQPGGSVRDEEVIAAANEHGIPMVFTGRRHFKH